MDSRLDSIFRTTFRQTESVDTGMGIRREDPRDEHKRKDGDGDQKKEEPVWEDDMVVSIAGLRQFLTTLIAPDSVYQPPTPPPAAPTQASLSTQQQRAHNAASAYQATARHSTAAISAATPPSPPPASSSAATPGTLSQEENRIIYQLLNDLDVLLQEGVTSLRIQKQGSFLESLHRAARATLDAIR